MLKISNLYTELSYKKSSLNEYLYVHLFELIFLAIVNSNYKDKMSKNINDIDRELLQNECPSVLDMLDAKNLSANRVIYAI